MHMDEIGYLRTDIFRDEMD